MSGAEREEILQFLGRHPYFAGLDDRALRQVADCVVVRRMPRDSVIVMQGDPPAAVYLIAHGQVRISRFSPDGREQALMDLLPGQVFNLVAAIDGRPTPSTAIARTTVVLYVIHRSDFWHLLHTYPQLTEAVLVDFAARLRRFTALVEDLSLRTVAERLARLLLEMAGETCRTDSTLLLPLTSEQLLSACAGAGFAEPIRYGSMKGEPFDPENSSDLVLAGRAGG